MCNINFFFFFFSSRRRHTRLTCDWSPDVCSSDLGTAVTEIVPFDDASILEQLHGAIDGRDRNAVVDRGAASIELLHVGVVISRSQRPGNDAALLRHAHALGCAQGFDVLAFGYGRHIVPPSGYL